MLGLAFLARYLYLLLFQQETFNDSNLMIYFDAGVLSYILSYKYHNHILKNMF